MLLRSSSGRRPTFIIYLKQSEKRGISPHARVKNTDKSDGMRRRVRASASLFNFAA